MAGDEVVLAFLSLEQAHLPAVQSMQLPVRVLGAFQRISLLPGQSQTVKLQLAEASFRHFVEGKIGLPAP